MPGGADSKKTILVVVVLRVMRSSRPLYNLFRVVTMGVGSRLAQLLARLFPLGLVRVVSGSSLSWVTLCSVFPCRMLPGIRPARFCYSKWPLRCPTLCSNHSGGVSTEV